MKKYETEMDIMGKLYKITFYSDIKEYNKHAQKVEKVRQNTTNGTCNYKNQEISVYLIKWEKDGYLYDRIENVLWHEVAHAIDNALPSSIEWSERIPSVVEMIRVYSHQLSQIMEWLYEQLEKKEENK